MRPLLQSERFLMVAPPVLSGVVILTGWETACRVFHVPEFLFPAPSVIASVFLKDSPSLFRALGSTLEVTLIAFVLAVVIGVMTASCSCKAGRSSAACFPMP